MQEKRKRCVHCGLPQSCLFKQYSKTSIRLTRCARCKNVADDYIECEFVLVLLDLVLHRIQAYRHVVFNRPPFCQLSAVHMVRLVCCVCVLDAMITVEIQQQLGEIRLKSSKDPILDYIWYITLGACCAAFEYGVFSVFALSKAWISLQHDWKQVATLLLVKSHLREEGGNEVLDKQLAAPNLRIDQAQENGQAAGSASKGPASRREGGAKEPAAAGGEGGVAAPAVWAEPLVPGGRAAAALLLLGPAGFKAFAVAVGVWDRQLPVLNMVSILAASAQVMTLKVALFERPERAWQTRKALGAVAAGLAGRALAKQGLRLLAARCCSGGASLVSFWVF